MATTINDDKKTIYKILSSNQYIENLGFEDRNILRTRTTTEKIDVGLQQIFIYNVAPEKSASAIVSNIVYQLDVTAPNEKYNAVDMCVEQIQALLHNADIGNTHTLRLLDPPQTLSTSSPTIYTVGIRFVSSETIFNKVKTI